MMAEEFWLYECHYPYSWELIWKLSENVLSQISVKTFETPAHELFISDQKEGNKAAKLIFKVRKNYPGSFIEPLF